MWRCLSIRPHPCHGSAAHQLTLYLLKKDYRKEILFTRLRSFIHTDFSGPVPVVDRQAALKTGIQESRNTPSLLSSLMVSRKNLLAVSTAALNGRDLNLLP
ncbi:hypothetical protein GN956_G10027 [Arapaima gigas]